MQKEILTREKIKIDLRKIYFNTIRGVIIGDILWLIIFGLSFGLPDSLFRLACYICLFIFICSFVIMILCSICFYRIKKNRFDILIDTLVAADDKVSLSDLYVQQPYVLYFSTYGKYNIPTENNYKWSELYCMSDSGVYNYSVLGDTFYLVKSKRKEILVAYNTKLFELQEPLTEKFQQ